MDHASAHAKVVIVLAIEQEVVAVFAGAVDAESEVAASGTSRPWRCRSGPGRRCRGDGRGWPRIGRSRGRAAFGRRSWELAYTELAAADAVDEMEALLAPPPAVLRTAPGSRWLATWVTTASS